MKKNDKVFEIGKLSKEVVVDIMDYLHDNNEELRLKSIKSLETIAKHYRITLRNKLRPGSEEQIREDLKAFILNNAGYNTNIVNLYYSLKNK